MMQAFFYRHLVPAQEWLVGHRRPRAGADPLQASRLESGQDCPRAERRQLHFIGPHGPMIQTVQMTLSEPPDGLSIQKVTPSADGIDVVLRADAAKLKPGWKGNAIIEASVERVPEAQKGKAQPVKRRVSLGMLPAVPVEVVGK